MTKQPAKTPVRPGRSEKAKTSASDPKKLDAAEDAVNAAFGRLNKDEQIPVNQSIAFSHLVHYGDAIPMVHFLASKEEIHKTTRASLAEWLLNQYRNNKIKRKLRGSPNQLVSRRIPLGDLGTMILHPDAPGNAVEARIKEGMSQNKAIAWVTEFFNRLDPNGGVISEETVRRSYRRVRTFAQNSNGCCAPDNEER